MKKLNKSKNANKIILIDYLSVRSPDRLFVDEVEELSSTNSIHILIDEKKIETEIRQLESDRPEKKISLRLNIIRFFRGVRQL
jgi:hypothetical protein